MKIKISLYLFIFIIHSSVYAKTITNPTLEQFYDRTQSMQADFVQTITDSKGKVIEVSKGELIFSRPDKFIFEYISPAEQKYISNSKTLWIYDVELEQVSIKSLDKGLGDSPALLLSSNSNVYQYYDVNNVKLMPLSQAQQQSLQWVQLKAKKEDTTFERVLLGFDEHKLKEMKMYDNFGQLTVLRFSNIQLNKPFANRQFDFVAPEGVDVIGTVDAR